MGRLDRVGKGEDVETRGVVEGALWRKEAFQAGSEVNQL